MKIEKFDIKDVNYLNQSHNFIKNIQNLEKEINNLNSLHQKI
jgi:hypothetical protein